jgi:hypothetical protein
MVSIQIEKENIFHLFVTVISRYYRDAFIRYSMRTSPGATIPADDVDDNYGLGSLLG